MGEPLVQRNGLFQAAVPTDWLVQRSDYDATIPRARITFASSNRLSVVEMLVQFGVNYPSHQALSDNFLTSDYFSDAWADYDSSSETSRTVGDTVTVDFDLKAFGVDFLGRQIAWLDGDWLHMIRIIVPDNNPALLDELTRLEPPTFISFDDQRTGDFNYVAYEDHVQGFLLRHPLWQIVSGTPGSPAIFDDPVSDTRLFVRSFEDTPLGSLEEAENYLTETYRPGSEVIASQVTTRQFGEGYMVSYRDVDNESNEISGMVVLLNDVAGKLHVADVRLNEAGIDLLSSEFGTTELRIRNILNTFMPLPPADYVNVPAENPPVLDVEAVEPKPDETEEPTPGE
jgi:hypothetical protein